VKLRVRFDSMLLYFRNSYNMKSVDLSMCVGVCCVCVCSLSIYRLTHVLRLKCTEQVTVPFDELHHLKQREWLLRVRSTLNKSGAHTVCLYHSDN
jgi:hypothetical protein